jgi:hypothetical protein
VVNLASFFDDFSFRTNAVCDKFDNLDYYLAKLLNSELMAMGYIIGIVKDDLSILLGRKKYAISVFSFEDLI